MKCKFTILVCSSLAALAAVPAAAQVTAPVAANSADEAKEQQRSRGLDEIVVTARRVSENLQSIPVSITALSGEALERNSVVNITDIGKAVPNLFIREGPQDPSSVFIVIRGQSQPDSLITIDNAVGLYVDGINYPRSFGMRGNMIDVARIEVLRGPQGTLYGKNTTGGAFSVITNDPTDELGASLKLNAGNYQSFGGTAILNVPVTDGVGLRVVGSFSERNKGYGSDGLGRELQEESNRFVRAKLLIEPSDNLSIKIAADYQRYESSGPVINLGGTITPGLGAISYGLERGTLTFASAGLIPGTPGDPAAIAAAAAAFQAEATNDNFYDSNGTFGDGSRFQAAGVSLDLNWELSDAITLRSITGYRWYERDSAYDFDLTSTTVLAPHTITPYDRNATQEFQLLGDYDDINFVFGLYGSDEEGKDGSNTQNLGALTGFALNRQDATINSRSLGAFAQATWEFSQGTSLTGGFRYTSERKIMASRNRNISATGVVTCNVPDELLDTPGICEGTLDATFSKPAWLISLDHKFDEGTLIYAKVSRGFRGGGHNLRGASTVGSFQPFRPETNTEYETGVKTELFDRRLRLNAAAFYAELEDVQRSVLVSVGDTTTATVVTNAASARIYGGELEASLRATDNLSLNGGISYTNAKYEEFIDFTGDRSNEDFGSPEFQFNISANYDQPTTFGSINASANYYYQSDTNLSPSSQRRDEVIQKGYGLLGARLGASFDNLDLDVALYGRNLTNKKYSTTAVGLEALGYNILFAGEPRTVGLEITKRFGGERRR